MASPILPRRCAAQRKQCHRAFSHFVFQFLAMGEFHLESTLALIE